MSFNSGDSFWEAINLYSQRYMQCVDSRFLLATFFIFALAPERQPAMLGARSVHNHTHFPQSKP